MARVPSSTPNRVQVIRFQEPATQSSPPFGDVRVSAAPSGLMKVAVTLLLASMVTEQEAVPVQSPLHPAKVEPVAAVAVRVTTVPLVKAAEQVEPQSMPA